MGKNLCPFLALPSSPRDKHHLRPVPGREFALVVQHWLCSADSTRRMGSRPPDHGSKRPIFLIGRADDFSAGRHAFVCLRIPAGPCADADQQMLQEAHAAKRCMSTVLGDLKRLATPSAAFLDDEVYGGMAQWRLDHAAAIGRSSLAGTRRAVSDLGVTVSN